MSTGAPAIGSQLLHYRVLSRLGAGGMGEVFLAEDTRLGRQVALKFLVSSGRPPFVADTMADTADRILNHEPEALARFNYAAPADVEAVVRKGLSKDPAFRYQLARELCVDLHHARERLLREPHSASHHTWRPGMHLPPVGFGQAASAPVSTERSVAVLTFANLTGNPADEWVGQGMAESLTTDFAKVRGLRSISREQIYDVQRAAGGPQGRMVDERQSIDLGRRLGATWVVAGAIQRLGDRVRITAQTIAVQEGRTVSATKIDGTMNDMFELQDRLIEDLVRQGLQREFEQSERRALGEEAHSPEALWRLPRDPDFAGVLASPVVAAGVLQTGA